MEVTGNFIKRRRLSYGFSQHRLAKGICAQATVSLIENKNSCPNLRILAKIGCRLNVSIESMINDQFNSSGVERAILNDDYSQAKLKLSEISYQQFRLHRQMDRYFCYQGALSVTNTDYHNALYFFNKVLSLNSNPIGENYRAWAKIGLSYVYYNQNDSNKALEFAKCAKSSLNFKDACKFNLSIRLFIKLRVTLAKLFNQLRLFTQSNLICFQTIKDSVKIHSMYKLSEVYTQISCNYKRLNCNDQAKSALTQAKVFRQMYKRPKVLPLRVN